MMRHLVIETDGDQVQVLECQLSPLELVTVFRMLSESLTRGQFPFPNKKPPVLTVEP